MAWVCTHYRVIGSAIVLVWFLAIGSHTMPATAGEAEDLILSAATRANAGAAAETVMPVTIVEPTMASTSDSPSVVAPVAASPFTPPPAAVASPAAAPAPGMTVPPAAVAPSLPQGFMVGLHPPEKSTPIPSPGASVAVTPPVVEIPGVDFKVSAIVGQWPQFVAVIEYANETYIVQPGNSVPSAEAPILTVRGIGPTVVEVFDPGTRQIVRRTLEPLARR